MVCGRDAAREDVVVGGRHAWSVRAPATDRPTRSSRRARITALHLVGFGDEATCPDGQAAAIRAERGHLEKDSQLERWDEAGKSSSTARSSNELASLRLIVGQRLRRQDLPAHAL